MLGNRPNSKAKEILEFIFSENNVLVIRQRSEIDKCLIRKAELHVYWFYHPSEMHDA